MPDLSNPDPKLTPNYLARVLALAARLPKGGVHHVQVLHDDSCALLAGRGPCDRAPGVRVGGPP